MNMYTFYNHFFYIKKLVLWCACETLLFHIFYGNCNTLKIGAYS
jgi:hypothetical protein